jgi:hypothetical protein
VERTAVTSGAIRSLGYEESSQTLEVEFRTGRVYQYEGVPAATYAWLLRVDNKGGFINRMIIPHHAAREVTAAAAPTLDLETALRASVETAEEAGEPEPDS